MFFVLVCNFCLFFVLFCVFYGFLLLFFCCFFFWRGGYVCVCFALIVVFSGGVHVVISRERKVG